MVRWRRTAPRARLHGLDGFGSVDVLEVSVVAPRHPKLLGVVVHEVQALAKGDVTCVRGIATTGIARTLSDLGSVCEPDRVLQALDDARRRRLSTAWMPRHRGRLAPARSAGDGDAARPPRSRPTRKARGPDSWFERLVERCLASAELPALHRQYVVRDRAGCFVGRLDAAFPSIKLGIEAHSRAYHDGQRPEAADESRDLRLAAEGWEVLYVRWHHLQAPDRLLDVVVASRIPTNSCLTSQCSRTGLGRRARPPAAGELSAESAPPRAGLPTMARAPAVAGELLPAESEGCSQRQDFAPALGRLDRAQGAEAGEHPFAGIGWKPCRRSRSSPTSSPRATSPRPSTRSPRASSGGDRFQTLLGITGSGKSATIAWTIEQVQRPTLVLAPNKSLAAQLANEFREFFPENRVEYFVCYYDYYQPEAYIASSDTYIEKDSSVNDEIDRLRHSATVGAAHPARRHRRGLGVVHLRPRLARGVPRAAARPRRSGEELRPARRSSASSSTCSTSATT